MQQLQQFLFLLPEIPQRILTHIENAEKNDSLKESEISLGITRALEDRQLKPRLQGPQIHRRPVQCFSHGAESVHSGPQPFAEDVRVSSSISRGFLRKLASKG